MKLMIVMSFLSLESRANTLYTKKVIAGLKSWDLALKSLIE